MPSGPGSAGGCGAPSESSHAPFVLQESLGCLPGVRSEEIGAPGEWRLITEPECTQSSEHTPAGNSRHRSDIDTLFLQTLFGIIGRNCSSHSVVLWAWCVGGGEGRELKPRGNRTVHRHGCRDTGNKMEKACLLASSRHLLLHQHIRQKVF
eukprot:GHVS01066681.1.p1 GENE.GHVS01066681.1~~GHVS01066681.1.p1  ORF type:complete len:151 (+),score=20.42 GHVS01066681.1:189-641(+)